MEDILNKKPNKKEAKILLEKYSKLMQDLKLSQKLTTLQKNDITICTQKYVEEEIENNLSQIDISNICKGKLKDCVSAFNKQGYYTYLDLYKAIKSTRMKKVGGVSAKSTATIVKEIVQIVEEIKKNFVPRLSIENKTVNAGALVLALYKYKESMPLIKHCETLYFKYSSLVHKSYQEAIILTNMFWWVTASKQSKTSAINAYLNIQELEEICVFKSAKYSLDTLNNINSASVETAWLDFEKNSAKYFAILELLQGFKASNSTFKNGLSSDLALSIESLNLNLDGLKCVLRSYQEFGVKYILHQQKVLLGDDMGLGKTVQAIASMVAVRNMGETRFLVVCPASVLINWCREIAMHSDLKAIKIHGENRINLFNQWVADGGVAVTTYETLSKLDFFTVGKISMLVVDEAHYVKNPKAVRTTKLMQVKLMSNRVLYMTGTALENNIEEMSFLLEGLQPEIVKSIHKLKDISTAKLFREKISPVYFRRTREDVLRELPDLIEKEEWCELTPEENEIYAENTRNKNFMGMRQVSWQIDNVFNSSKAQRLLEIYSKAVAEKRKIIVFSFFLDTLKKVQTLLKGNCFGPITGAVSPAERQKIIDDFSSSKPGSVLVAQIQAGGTGLNIQAASMVVICEPQLKPSIENQAIARAYRMGQIRNVMVYRLLCDESIDERIMEILNAKDIVFDSFADKSTMGDYSLQITEATYNKIIENEISRLNKIV